MLFYKKNKKSKTDDCWTSLQELKQQCDKQRVVKRMDCIETERTHQLLEGRDEKNDTEGGGIKSPRSVTAHVPSARIPRKGGDGEYW